jgi:hypothetical protein
MCRKYSKFNITITYLNGDTENIQHEDYNSTSYKDMLELYKMTKEHYKDECVTIDFIGVTDTGSTTILFTKNIINDKELKIKEEAKLVDDMNVEELVHKLGDITKLLKKKYEKSFSQRDIANKQLDNILHQIESIDRIDYNIEINEKDMINEIHNIRVNRRQAKNNIEILQLLDNKHFLQQIDGKVMMAKQKVQQLKNEYDKVEFLDKEKIVEKKIMKEVPYRSFKERIQLMKQLSKDFNKICYDDAKMIIICYNNAH